jgi:hypothetical protein
MIKFENTEVLGWEAAIRGMRNPMNSWEKSDSELYHTSVYFDECNDRWETDGHAFGIGPNDLDLMKRLRNAGTDHRKFMRMITVYVDITAPLYWWKEFDTYKVGTVANSCSTMHKIAAKEFTLEDFSWDQLLNTGCNLFTAESDNGLFKTDVQPIGFLTDYIIPVLNTCREKYLETKDKEYWWQMIQLLPSSYNQKRTVMMNYEVLANIYKSRKNHKLDEWAETKLTGDCPADMYPNKFTNGFCDWIKTLPYSELITGEENTHA